MSVKPLGRLSNLVCLLLAWFVFGTSVAPAVEIKGSLVDATGQPIVDRLVYLLEDGVCISDNTNSMGEFTLPHTLDKPTVTLHIYSSAGLLCIPSLSAKKGQTLNLVLPGVAPCRNPQEFRRLLVAAKTIPADKLPKDVNKVLLSDQFEKQIDESVLHDFHLTDEKKRELREILHGDLKDLSKRLKD
jgi:hypothetical protein